MTSLQGISVCRINCEYNIGQDEILFQHITSAINYAKERLPAYGLDFEEIANENLISFEWVTIK